MHSPPSSPFMFPFKINHPISSITFNSFLPSEFTFLSFELLFSVCSSSFSPYSSSSPVLAFRFPPIIIFSSFSPISIHFFIRSILLSTSSRVYIPANLYTSFFILTFTTPSPTDIGSSTAKFFFTSTIYFLLLFPSCFSYLRPVYANHILSVACS